LVCLAAAAGAAAGRALLVGAAEDAPKQETLVGAVAKLELARLAGLSTVRVTSLWEPGLTAPAGWERDALGNAAAAAQLTGMRLIVSVYPRGGSVAPTTPARRAQFAAYAAALAEQLLPLGVTDYIVGNEPNLNRFWMPQFARDGSNAAARAYLALLAQTYDALKAVSPDISVIGGALSPRGSDRPSGRRPTHSPTRFLLDLGAAYRASGRSRPIMDAFAFHPYLEASRLPPELRHPRSTSISLNDYEKLVALLGRAFDGTAQQGRALPILYDEFGVQTQIDPAESRRYAHAAAPAAADAVPEWVQAAYYRRALELASCQPTVVGLLFFHVSDEADLRAWQSGLYYADDTPKSSLGPVRAAAQAAEAGRLVRCSL